LGYTSFSLAQHKNGERERERGWAFYRPNLIGSGLSSRPTFQKKNKGDKVLRLLVGLTQLSQARPVSAQPRWLGQVKPI